MDELQQYGTKLLRSTADRIVIGIRVGHDWPNSQHELDCLQAARLLRAAADRIDGAKRALNKIATTTGSDDTNIKAQQQ